MYQNRKSHDMKMLEEISAKREIMIDCANKSGLTSDETIRFSQELDELINKYQRTIKSLYKAV